MAKVSFKDVSFKYGANQILKNFSLDIESGEILCLVGPSGCGKTTLVRCLLGLNKPETGEIYVGDNCIFSAGRRINQPVERRNIGIVFQDYAVWPHLTVSENVGYPLKKKRIGKAEIAQRVADTLAMVNMTEYANHLPSQLSGGQQQRVAIARALVKNPSVLLLDEPLSNLDARLRLQTREEIRRIQRETKITTIFVTHDQEEAMSISDLIIVMKDGVVQQIGRPQDVYDNPANLFVAKFLGTPPINVFHGRLLDGQLCIGEEAVLSVRELQAPSFGDVSSSAGNASGAGNSEVLSDAARQDVYVGIRPEGFIVQEDGPFSCTLKGVEVMGRDISVLSYNNASLNPTVRSIIGAQYHVDAGSGAVRFALNPRKVLLFAKDTETRIK